RASGTSASRFEEQGRHELWKGATIMSSDEQPNSQEARSEESSLSRREFMRALGVAGAAGSALLAGSEESALAKPHAKGAAARAQAGKKPNILFIMGDDVGWFNVGAYHRGIMSGKTPNLDKLAAEGMLFTDYYAEASCTAGRANFITGEI